MEPGITGKEIIERSGALFPNTNANNVPVVFPATTSVVAEIRSLFLQASFRKGSLTLKAGDCFNEVRNHGFNSGGE